ncbi:MAG: hypothetical protein M3209_18630 [Acidobacteriota bacterium]|nr:hypothetical protein [Acidobacteriota bacterium]
MNKISRIFVFALSLFAFVCFNPFDARAQENNQKTETSKESYEVVLQLLKSNAPGETGNNQLPNSLQPIAKKLRADFNAADYGLMMTLLNRVSADGNLEIKAVNPFSAQQTDLKSIGFYDLTLHGIKPNLPGAIQIDLLRFGIKVPVTTFVANNGNSTPITNYENLGITTRPLSIDLNEPTVVGTLTTSRPNELLVLVMTIKPENRPVAKKN